MAIVRNTRIIVWLCFAAIASHASISRAEPKGTAKPFHIPGWSSNSEFQAAKDRKLPKQVVPANVETYLKRVKASIGKCWYDRMRVKGAAMPKNSVTVAFEVSSGGILTVRSVTAGTGANAEAVATARYAIEHAVVIEPPADVAAWIKKEGCEVSFNFLVNSL